MVGITRGVALLAASVGLLATQGLTAGGAAASVVDPLPSATRFYVPPPDPDGVRQVVQLARGGDVRDALLVGRMITTPQAVWFTGGTSAQLRRDVYRTVAHAAVTRS